MNKLGLLILTAMVGGCVYAGDIGVIDARKDFFAKVNGHSITRYEQEPQLVKSEYVDEKNFKLNQSMTAFRGYSILNNKVYRKDFYQVNYVKPNVTGALNSGSIPQVYKKDQKVKVLGEVSLNGEKWRIIPTDDEEFVALIDKNGKFNDHLAKLEGDNLIVLDSVCFPYPDNFKMIDIRSSSSSQTKPLKGFDVKFDGVRMDRIWFTYMNYEDGKGDSGTFENISFPNKPGLIEINGIGFRVLQVDNERIDYMVLKDNH